MAEIASRTYYVRKRDKQSDKGERGEPAGDLQPGRLMTASWQTRKQSTRLPCLSCPVLPRASLEREVKQAQTLERMLGALVGTHLTSRPLSPQETLCQALSQACSEHMSETSFFLSARRREREAGRQCKHPTLSISFYRALRSFPTQAPFVRVSPSTGKHAGKGG